MQPKDFVFKYLTAAKNAENYIFEKTEATVVVKQKTNVLSVTTLTQAAVESKWGDVAPGYNFFGVKDTDGLNGNEQLLLTHEYLNNPNVKFPVVESIKTIYQNGKKIYLYAVKDYFRLYKTPEDAFVDHAVFLATNERYSEALKQKDPIKQLEEIAKAGYATDPNYAKLLTDVAGMIIKYI